MPVRTWIRAGAAAVAVALLAGAPLAAHHSAAAAYDESKRVETQGTVTRVLLKNPHSWVFLEGTDEKGQKVEWQIELAAAASLGWTPTTLPIGTVVKVSGNPSRAPGSHGMTGARFTTLDGTPIGRRGQ
jgi:ABC-type dipeptide/oligopeptide/nickel transport system permease subunit